MQVSKFATRQLATRQLVRHCALFLAVWMLASLARSRAVAQTEAVWAGSLQEAQQIANERRCLVLVHFWDYNCAPCVRLERNVLKSPEVLRSMATNYVPVRVNVTDHPKIAERYNVRQWPTDVFLTPDGREVHRAVSQQDATRYVAVLDNVAAHARVARTPNEPLKRDMPYGSRQGTVNQTNDPRLVSNDPQDWRYQPQSRSAGGPRYRANHSEDGMAAESADRERQAASSAASSGPPQAGAETSRFGRASVDAAYDRSSANASAGEARLGDANPSSNASGVSAQRGPYGNADAQSARPYQAGGSPSRDAQTPADQAGATQAGAYSPSGTPSRWSAAPARQATAGESHANPGNPLLDHSGSANRVRAAAAAEATPSGPAAQTASGTSAAITNRFVNQEQSAPNASATHAAGDAAGGEPAVSLLPSAPPKIDPANPPLGLDGHCPVSLFEQEKWVKGDARFGARHRGRTYLFASKQHADQFFANPDQYSPVLSGYDPILLLEGKQWVAGERQHGIWLENNRMYLFSSEQTLQRFWEEREHWVPLAEQAMREQAANRVR